MASSSDTSDSAILGSGAMDGETSGTHVEVMGQVVAGWFPLRPDTSGKDELALSVQIVASSRPPDARSGSRARKRKGEQRRRLTLNIIGAGVGGAPLHSLEPRFETPPWKAIAGWSQRILESIERAQTRMEPAHLEARIEGVLTAIARRLEQGQRGQHRRTQHAEDRHQGGERPTRMALADLAEANDDRFLRDTLRDTVVVLGARGRAHVWSPAGKLVTSLRSSPEATERKIARGRWKPADPDDVAKLRAARSLA